MNHADRTTKFVLTKDMDNPARGIIKLACDAMQQKGYDPLNQLVGYILSGDPTYITSHKGARSLIRRVERDEIIELLLEDYINNNFK